MRNARKLVPECPFWEPSVTLGRVMGGELHFATGKADKAEMLAQAGNGAIFFVAWTGKYKTDLFLLEDGDISAVLAKR
jgi:hypothetical protein